MAVKQTTKNRIGAGKPGPGRPKGIPNRTTAAVKDMVIEALGQAGGVGYLVTQANDNPSAFLTLVGKVIPLQVAGDPNNPVKHVHRIELIAPKVRDDMITVELVER